jgi:hypothetical protein
MMADKRLEKCREAYTDDLTINPPKRSLGTSLTKDLSPELRQKVQDYIDLKGLNESDAEAVKYAIDYIKWRDDGSSKSEG